MSSAFEMELWEAHRPRSLAQLAESGITRNMTRTRAWRRTTRGYFVPADAPVTPTQRILEAVPLVPSQGALAGWAAAYVLGVDQLDGPDPCTLDPLALPLHLGHDVGCERHAGIRLVRERLAATDRLVWGLDIPVTTPLRTLFDGGGGLSHVQAVHATHRQVDALELLLAVVVGPVLSSAPVALTVVLGRQPSLSVQQVRRAEEVAVEIEDRAIHQGAG